jgi:hypothetical protein
MTRTLTLPDSIPGTKLTKNHVRFYYKTRTCTLSARKSFVRALFAIRILNSLLGKLPGYPDIERRESFHRFTSFQ